MTDLLYLAASTVEEIGELLTHLAFYGGWPVAMSGAMVAKDVLEQRKK